MTPKKTATEISNSIISELESTLNITIPLLAKAFLRVLAKSLGGVFVLLYQYAGFILLQGFVKTASNKPMTIGSVEVTPLKEWAALVGLSQKTGQRAELTTEITVLTQTGTIISGTRLINTSTEMIYTTVGDVDLDAATVEVTVRAVTVGELGNVDVDATLDFVSPPAAVEKETTVTSVDVVGSDAEETEVFRSRVLDRYAAIPQGGAYADYRDWAEAVEGVKNAYPYSGWQLTNHPEDGPTQGSGEVFVFIESEAYADGIPPSLGTAYGRPGGGDGALLLAVFNAIEDDDAGLASRRNINAYVRVYPISRTSFSVTVHGLAVEDETNVRTAIEDALTDYFLEREPYINGMSRPPRKDRITAGMVSSAVQVVAAAHGGSADYVTLTEGGSPVEYYDLQEGEKAKLGTLSWV